MKKVIIYFLLSVMLTSTLTSCMTTKTNVGKYRETTGNEYTYSKAKQIWLFWGILPIGRTHTETPSDGNCQVVTKLNFVDFLISGLTGGIVMTETIKIKAKK